jgi:hypothetical protein
MTDRQEICSMERHDTMLSAKYVLGAARYLVGAGTCAAAILATTAAASAQTSVCNVGGEGDPTFCGHVFTDTNNDGSYDDGEGVADVHVAITDESGANVANSPTPTGLCPDEQNCGYYSFVVYEPPGTEYWICLVTDPNQADCRDTTAHPESVKVAVGEPPFHDFEIGGGSEEPPSDVWGVGTGTPGYWKNHPEAWPAAGVTVGGVLYKGPTIQNAIKLMGKVGGDKSVTIFASLISAKLNTMLANNTTCIMSTITQADAWMTAHPVGSGVKGSSAAWAEGEPLHQKMDDYNNGKLCAPHRD